jgi:hypothetical protein
MEFNAESYVFLLNCDSACANVTPEGEKSRVDAESRRREQEHIALEHKPNYLQTFPCTIPHSTISSLLATSLQTSNPHPGEMALATDVWTIYERFLRRGAALEINVSAGNRMKVEQCFLEHTGVDLMTEGEARKPPSAEDRVPINILDSVRHEVFKLLENDVLPRYGGLVL